MNEHALLLIIAILLWIKAFVQLKWIESTGALYSIVLMLVYELLTFCVFYFAILFLYTMIGMVLFRNFEEFSSFRAAIFTLF